MIGLIAVHVSFVLVRGQLTWVVLRQYCSFILPLCFPSAGILTIVRYFGTTCDDDYGGRSFSDDGSENIVENSVWAVRYPLTEDTCTIALHISRYRFP